MKFGEICFSLDIILYKCLHDNDKVYNNESATCYLFVVCVSIDPDSVAIQFM